MKNLVKDFFIYGIASILGKLIAVFLMPLYTSILTKEEYGTMALIISVRGVIDVFSNLNIHSGVARDYYEKDVDRNKLVSTGFYSIIAISLFVLLFTIATKDYWAYTVLNIKHVYMSSFVLMLCSMPVGSLNIYFSVLSRFKKKALLYSIGVLIQLIVQVGISCYGIIVIRAGIVSVFLGLFVGEILSTLYFIIINRELISLSFRWAYIKRILSFSIPTLPAIIAGWLDTSMGQILISKYISVDELGVYSIALSLASGFTLINVAFQNVWSPFLYENYLNKSFPLQIKKIYTGAILGLAFIAMALSLFSKEIVLLLSNVAYIDAAKYFTLLCIPMCIYVLFPFASSGITISRKTKYIAISYMVGTVCNLVALYILVRSIGVVAVPICLAMSRVVTYYTMMIVSEKKVHFHLPNYYVVLLVILIIAVYMVNIRIGSLIIRTILFLSCSSLMYFLLNKAGISPMNLLSLKK